MENLHTSSNENKLANNDSSVITQELGLKSSGGQQNITDLTAPGPSAMHTTYMDPPFRSTNNFNSPHNNTGRFMVVASGQFTTGSTTTVYNAAVDPNILLAPALNNFRGCAAYRATIVYRLEIAAAPQASGVVRMAAQACGEPNSRIKYRAATASMMGAEVNLTHGSSIELRVPYIKDRDFHYINSPSYSNSIPWHTIAVIPYLPVCWDTTTVSTPTWTLFAAMEDVEHISAATALLAVVPQAAAELKATGPVTKFFRAAATIATAASMVPTLAMYAKPVAWLSAAGALVSAHFGWSKPNNGSYTAIMGSSVMRGHNTCADSDFAQPLSMYANNEVAMLPGFAGSSVDEMAICAIICRAGAIAQVRLQPSDLAGTVKWVAAVTPGNLWFQAGNPGLAQQHVGGLGGVAGANKYAVLPSPLMFIASYFARWRGTIIYRFKFGTTRFHAGKVLIGYVPAEDKADNAGPGLLSQAPAYTDRFDFQSILVDLRTTTELDFPVPFTYPADYCNTGMNTSTTLSNWSPPNTGVIFMRVIEPLYGPDNVPQFAPVMVEALADCDFEFAQPITSQLQPLRAIDSPVVIAQSGAAENELVATHTSGERILSLKQLAMRPMWRYQQYLTGIATIQDASLNYAPPITWAAGAHPWLSPTVHNDSIISRISSIYALHRGGLNLKVLPPISSTAARTGNFASTISSSYYASNDLRYSAFGVEYTMGNNVRIPYYGKHNRTITPFMQTVSHNLSEDDNNRITLCNLGGVDSSALVGVSAADDYQAGCFVGIPPCVFLDPEVQQDAYFNTAATRPVT